MSNEVVDLNVLNAEELNAQLGFNTRKQQPFPYLKINREAEDDNGNTLPVGTFYIDDGVNERVYSKNIEFKILFRGYQYINYNADTKRLVDSSVILPTFFGEFKSTSGKIACGRLSKKRMDEGGAHLATQEQLSLQKSVKLKTMLFGTVSYKGKTQDGTEVEVVDQLVMYKPSASAAMEFDKVIKSIVAEGRAVANTTLAIKTKREKNGDNVYYVPVVTIEQGAGSVVKNAFALVTKVLEFVKANNTFVEERYAKALKGGAASVASDMSAAMPVSDEWED